MARDGIRSSLVLHCHGLLGSFSAEYEELISLSALEKGKRNGVVGAPCILFVTWEHRG